MKKFLALTMIAILSVLLAGCYQIEYPDLSEENSNAIAQYSAYLLLKYDKNQLAERKLLDKKELEDIYKERDAEATKVPTPSTAEPDTVTGEPTPVPTDDPVATPSASPTAEPTQGPAKDDEKKAESLNALYGEDSFEITYSKHNLTNVYSETDASAFYAKDGEKILVVEFNIKNTSRSKKRIYLLESNVDYYIHCKNGDIYSPAMSFLPNDIITLDTEIDSFGNYTAVLICFIKDTDTPEKLHVQNEKTGYSFDITLN